MIETFITSQRETEEGVKWRPDYHFTAPYGWLNDPNGLIYYAGWYHLFYQYNPKHCEWASMHWGHAVSKNMVNWEDLPIALTPDEAYDDDAEGGCFSGSAIEKDGILYLFYTATQHENGKVVQTQCMASSEDGVHFKKYADNPVIKTPPEGITEAFRDPKVFSYHDKWYMVVGASIGNPELDGDGRVLLYESEDFYHWNYKSSILESRNLLGTMFECPDFYPLGDKWILTCSPMKHPHNNKAMYCVGTMDFESGQYQVETYGNMDQGFDYYAPQSFLDRYGNRVTIGWQNGWLWMPWCDGFGPTSTENWRGALSIPRRVTLTESGQLKFYPVEELNVLREKISTLLQVQLKENQKIELPTNRMNSYMLKVMIDEREVGAKEIRFGLMSHEDEEAVITIDIAKKELIFDKSNADVYGRGTVSCAVRFVEHNLELLIAVDKSSIEIYINQGETCMTFNVYPEEKQVKCWVQSPGETGTVKLIEVMDMLNFREEKQVCRSGIQ